MICNINIIMLVFKLKLVNVCNFGVQKEFRFENYVMEASINYRHKLQRVVTKIA